MCDDDDAIAVKYGAKIRQDSGSNSLSLTNCHFINLPMSDIRFKSNVDVVTALCHCQLGSKDPSKWCGHSHNTNRKKLSERSNEVMERPFFTEKYIFWCVFGCGGFQQRCYVC